MNRKNLVTLVHSLIVSKVFTYFRVLHVLENFALSSVFVSLHNKA